MLRHSDCDLYALARDNPQGRSVLAHILIGAVLIAFARRISRSRILGAGTFLSAISKRQQRKFSVASRPDGAKYPFGFGHVAHRDHRHSE